MKITPAKIESLKPTQIFVFGSNEVGIHGAGAALFAKRRFGAMSGKGVGLHGRSYAIPTKDRHIEALGLSKIGKYVEEFLLFAKAHPDLEFFVTAIGTGLAGLTAEQVAPLFLKHEIHSNVSLPAEFWAVQKAQQTSKKGN